MRKQAVGLLPLVFALGCEPTTVADKSEKARPTPRLPTDQSDISWDENGRLVINDPELAAQVRAFCNLAPDEVGTVRAQIRLGGGAGKAGYEGDSPDDGGDIVVDVRC